MAYSFCLFLQFTKLAAAVVPFIDNSPAPLIDARHDSGSLGAKHGFLYSMLTTKILQFVTGVENMQVHSRQYFPN